MRTLLAVSQVTSLTLDLVNRVFGILDVRHVGRRDPTGIRKDSEGVIYDAHESDGGEYDGVHNSR